MYATFSAIGLTSWSITDWGIQYGSEQFLFQEISSVNLQNTTNTRLLNGVIVMVARGKRYALAFPYKQKQLAETAYQVLLSSYGTGEQRAAIEARQAQENEGLVYHLRGVRGRSIKIYEDRAVIKVQASLGSFITGNVSDGEKTIYFADCVGVQFKESGVQIGYLQLETASGLMNNAQSNFFNENSFTFDTSVISNEQMREVADYVRGRVAACKQAQRQPVTVQQQYSPADELKKFKELLDMGAITQEEFDAKKKQLLGF